MKKVFWFFLGLALAYGVCFTDAQAVGLDEIYRDLVHSDNRGYLPLYVKNRQAPNMFDDESLENDIKRPEIIDAATLKGLEDINLANERQKQSAQAEAAQLRWQRVLKNIQVGYVTSVELDELYAKEEEKDPQAIEVLAWIYAKGIGVAPDLVRSFLFYKEAAKLNVPDAADNAIKVYRAMSSAQKAQLDL